MIVWTSPFVFGELPHFAPELLKELKKADLTIWKGDLNYRRLVGYVFPSLPPPSPFLSSLSNKSQRTTFNEKD